MYDNPTTPANLLQTTIVPSAESAAFDAFQRLRVSEPESILSSRQVYDNLPLMWDDQETSGSGTSSTHSTALAASTMSVSATTAGKRTRQTFESVPYSPGKSQLAMFTAVLGTGASGIDRRVGLFDDNNGVFFELAGTTLRVVRRTNVTGSPVDNVVASDSWNVDPLDGTGASNVNLDTSKANIYFVDFEWLGVGSVRFGVVVDGQLVVCHQMRNANDLTTVFMSTADLPARYEIENDGAGAAASLVAICTSVVSEGGQRPPGMIGAVSTGATHVDASTTDLIYAIIGIRLKAAQLRAPVEIVSISMLNETAVPFGWKLLLNPTVAGTFAYSDETNRAIQSATGATANTVTGGTLLAAGFVAAGGAIGGSAALQIVKTRRLGAAIDGTPDEFVLCGQPLGSNSDIQGAIMYREI